MIIHWRSQGIDRLGGILLAIFLLILSGCRAASPVNDQSIEDKAIETANRAARKAFEKGQYQQAAKFYQTALKNAYIRGDGDAIENARYNLSICLMELQRYPEALEQVVQSQKEMKLMGTDISLDHMLLEATILYRSNRLDDAWQVTSALLLHQQMESSVVRMKTYFLRGLIASDRGNVQMLKKTIASMGDPSSEFLKADYLELRGRLAMALNKWQEAAAYLAASVKLRRKHLNYRRMRIALALSAQANAKSHRYTTAILHYFQAGRSAALAGEIENAREWLTRSLELSRQRGLENISAEAQYYLSQLNQNQDLPPQDRTKKLI